MANILKTVVPAAFSDKKLHKIKDTSFHEVLSCLDIIVATSDLSK